MYGHPIARSMERWWKEHADKHSDPEWHEWIDSFKSLIDEKYGEMAAEHTNIDSSGERVFGMASAGGCTRRNALKLLGYEEEPVSGSQKFTFYLGHMVEIAAVTTLGQIGYPIKDTQYSVEIGPMQSTADLLTEINGKDTLVSVKSVGYKMSGQRKGKWLRRGFAQLPFEGTYQANPGHWVQLQSELLASGLSQGLMLYCSKDMIQVFENDPYLGDDGNGSLTFYAELIKPDPQAQQLILETQEAQMNHVKNGEAGPPMYFTGKTGGYIELPKPAHVPASNKWSGPNQTATGTFNPCGGCSLVEACKVAS